MTANFRRKLMYMGMALSLFVVILLVRVPIQQIRIERELSDDTLGGVDPTSSTMVLVLGGLRGVAANLLWTQALDMQKEHDWANLEVVVKSIVKLEPHFISIWTFQGWNLAYNVSVEWDQVDDKYYWIKQGIKFLSEGTERNKHSPELRWDVGWTYFHKIGKADEAALLRNIFRNDDQQEIDAQGKEQPAFNRNKQDNYQASKPWFEAATQLCDRLDLRPKRMGEVAFRSYTSHAQINHVQADEEDGNFGESTQADWMDALGLLNDFADHEYVYLDGKKTKLDYPASIFSDMYRAVTLMTRVEALNDYAPKDWDKVVVRELVEQTRLVWPGQEVTALEELSSEDRAKMKVDWAKGVWEMIMRDTPETLKTFGQPTIAILPPAAGPTFAAAKNGFDKAKSLDPARLVVEGTEGDAARSQFSEFATHAIALGRLCHEELYWCDRYASMINFRYWKERTVAESETDTISARRHFFTGFNRFREGDLETAKKELEDGIELWKGVLDKYSRLRDDDITAEETMKIVRAYQAVCQQLDIEIPQDQLPFQDYLRKFMPMQMSQEQMQLMMKAEQEMRSLPRDEAEKKRKQLMEQFQGKAAEVPPTEPPQSNDK